MRLLVSTPTSVVVNADDVRYVGAEDETGAFGILRGHADFLTVLTVSVVTWRNERGSEHYVAVRGGVLVVEKGGAVRVATREAVAGDDLIELQRRVLADFRSGVRRQTAERSRHERLRLVAIQQICRYLSAERDVHRRPMGHGPARQEMPQ